MMPIAEARQQRGNSEHMFGANAMDLSPRPAARAGGDRGKALAGQLTEFCR
jgi:NTE family protein